MLLGGLFLIFMISLVVKTQPLCGFAHFTNRPEFDGYAFTNDKLATRNEISLLECLNNCFLSTECNMVVYITPVEECWVYSKPHTDLSYTVSKSSAKYYAVDCDAYKISSPACSPPSSPLQGEPVSSVQCHAQTQWVTAPASPVCVQTEWFNTMENILNLPIRNLTGVIIDAKLMRGDANECYLPIRTVKTPFEDIMMVRVLTSGWSSVGIYNGSSWVSTKVTDPFPVAKWITFDIHVVFSATHMQVTLNGNLLASVNNMVSTGDVEARLTLGGWEKPVEWVRLSYANP